MKDTVVIVAGGTGGHVFPAIALAETLKEKSKNVCILTDTRASSYWPPAWENIVSLPILPLRSTVGGVLKFLFSLLSSLWVSFGVFWRLNPQVIVTFGGYPTLPALMAGILLRRPIIIHEQNAVVGRVNRLFSRFAQCLAVSWPETRNLPLRSGLLVNLTGIPIRRAIASLHKRQFCSPKKEEALTVLILGGSQGAQVFNTLIPEALSLLSKPLQQRIEIIHQCRQETLKKVTEAYNKTKVKVTLQPFFDDIPHILSKVDFVIARSGASTLGELTTVGLPAILVPYQDAKDDHQTVNALNLDKRGAAWMIPQLKFTKNRLVRMFEAALQQPEILLPSSEASNPLKHHDASQKLASLIRSVGLDLNKNEHKD